MYFDIPIFQSKLKQIDAYGTVDHAPIINSIREGSFQGTIIGDMDEALLQEWPDWVDKNFSGKAEQLQSSPRNFDGKVHYIANKSLKDKHNVVILLPMVNVDSPYYAHSLILDVNLLTEFVGLLRRVTLSAEKANEIVNHIESTLNSLTYEQFSGSLKEFYMPPQATYFFEGEINTVGGLVN